MDIRTHSQLRTGSHKVIPISARVIGRPVADALTELADAPKGPARDLAKLIRSAAERAVKVGLDGESLSVTNIQVVDGDVRNVCSVTVSVGPA